MKPTTACLTILLALPAVPARADLVAYWRFDETSGTVAANSSGSVTNYDGALRGGAAFGPAKFGYGMHAFDGGDAMILNNNVVDLGAEWTMTTWFSTPIPSTGNWHTLARGLGGNHHVIGQTGTNLLGVYDNVTATAFRVAVPNFDLDDLSTPGFAHIAAVGSGGTTTFYINGVEVGVSPYQSTTDVFSVGNYFNSTDPLVARGGGQRWSGIIDDFAIFDSALTATDIATIWNNGQGLTIQDFLFPPLAPEPMSVVLWGMVGLLAIAHLAWRRRVARSD